MPLGKISRSGKKDNKEELDKARENDTLSSLSASNRYSDLYREQCFRAWWNAGKPTGNRLMEIIPEDEFGRKPHNIVLRSWMKQDDWNSRSLVLDEKAREVNEQQAIQQRAEMFKRHAEIGNEVLEMGLDFLRTKGISTDTQAIKAIQLGAAMERDARGVSEWMNKISGMKDDELLSRVRVLMKGLSEGDKNIIDAEVKELGEDFNDAA